MAGLVEKGNVRAVLAHEDFDVTFKVKGDDPAVFNLLDSGTFTSADSGEVKINWKQPIQPLTMPITSPFTATKEAYYIKLILPKEGSLSKLLQQTDDGDVEKSLTESVLEIDSDSYLLVIIKMIPTTGYTEDINFSYTYHKR